MYTPSDDRRGEIEIHRDGDRQVCKQATRKTDNQRKLTYYNFMAKVKYDERT